MKAFFCDFGVFCLATLAYFRNEQFGLNIQDAAKKAAVSQKFFSVIHKICIKPAFLVTVSQT